MKKINIKDLFKMSFFNIGEGDKINLIVLVTLVLSFLMGYFLLIPTVGAYKTNKLGIENEKQRIIDINTKANLRTELGRTIVKEKDFIDQGKYALPSEPLIPELLLTLNKIATSNSLYISSFVPKNEIPEKNPATGAEAVKKENWKTVELQFDVIGSYPNIKSFIGDLERNMRVVDIKNISIDGGGDLKSSESILRFQIGANVYYQ